MPDINRKQVLWTDDVVLIWRNRIRFFTRNLFVHFTLANVWRITRRCGGGAGLDWAGYKPILCLRLPTYDVRRNDAIIFWHRCIGLFGLVLCPQREKNDRIPEAHYTNLVNRIW